jgi:hypothetical protein
MQGLVVIFAFLSDSVVGPARQFRRIAIFFSSCGRAVPARTSWHLAASGPSPFTNEERLSP